VSDIAKDIGSEVVPLIIAGHNQRGLQRTNGFEDPLGIQAGDLCKLFRVLRARHQHTTDRKAIGVEKVSQLLNGIHRGQ
jgi:hypothetical protein